MSMPAARLTDMHVCPMVTGVVPHIGGPIAGPCSPTVFIGGLPAARIGDLCVCVGPPDVIVKGSMTVITSGMPQSRIGDSTVHGGAITMGCPTVLVGDKSSSGGGGGSKQGAAFKAAARTGKPFCEVCPA